jgi:hypothetical protein
VFIEAQLRVLLAVAFTGLLIVLRFDAARFAAAEYDDETAPGGWRLGLRRFSWYAIGFVLVAAIDVIYPRPLSELHLTLGSDRAEAIVLGFGAGMVGTAVAIAFAWFRYGGFRLPEWRHYPGAVMNAFGTALIDEVCFRGALLGMLLVLTWPNELAIAFQAILYALATRLGAPGRSRFMLLLSLGVAITAGYLTLATAGIGAAILGHAITRVAIFVCTGHAGTVRAPGEEPEEEAAERLPPAGWRVVGDGDRSARQDAWEAPRREH